MLALSLGLSAASGLAYTQRLDNEAIREAIAIGHTAFDGDRRAFHQAYRIVVSRPPLDFVDVITPFRRVELAAEERARQGDHRFGQRQALELLSPSPTQVTLRIEFTFHPLNAYVLAPEYDAVLVAKGRPGIRPVSQDRIPRFGTRTDDVLPPSVQSGGIAPLSRGARQPPMLGATLMASFDGETIDPRGVYDLLVTERGKDLGRAVIDLGRLR